MIDYVSDDSVYPEVGTYAITCPVGAISVLIKYAYPYQDVTRNYSITIIDGTLEIIKRQVAVSPVCNNKTYDGEAAVVEGFDDWHYGSRCLYGRFCIRRRSELCVRVYLL